jgi:RNA polymerase sigma factor (sigma-70 family)
MISSDDGLHPPLPSFGDRDALPLINRAASGDEAAQRELYDRLAPIIRGRLRFERSRAVKRLSPTLGLEDVAQHVWMVLVKDGYRQLLSYDPARGKSLAGYVGLIAGREYGNLTRTPHRETQEITEDARANGIDPETFTVASDLRRRCYQDIAATLSPRGKLVLDLFFLEQKTTGEVAHILGWREQAVSNWVFKIRRQIEEWLSRN